MIGESLEAMVLRIRGDAPVREAELQAWLADRLRKDGYNDVRTEVRLFPLNERVDVVATRGNRTYLIELKVTNPQSGIGQILMYRLRWKREATAVLAVFEKALPPEGMMSLAIACRQAGVELWLVARFGHYDRLEEAS